MLFRCLNPMELDTGPWTRKSSILCSLLLLATFFVLQVSGQAETIGLGKHTLMKDGKVNLNTSNNYNYVAVKNIDFPEYEMLPGSCNVTIKDGFIELQYNGKLCTVELLSYFNKTIKFKAGVRNEAGLSNCLGCNRSESYSNVLPFIYSKNNGDIERFSKKGPTTTNETCKDKGKSGEGKCLNGTSLEISWHTDKKKRVHAHIHLIREVEKGVTKFEPVEDNKEMIFGFEIKAEEVNVHEGDTLNPKKALCTQGNNTIVKPAAWTITNTLLKDEYLLVFSMLPTKVSRVYDGTDLMNDPQPSGPKCTLFVQFSTEHYRLLTAIPPPTCTTTSTTTQTTTTTTTEAPSTITTSCPTMKSDPVITTTTSAIANLTTKCPKCPEESKTGIYVLLGIVCLLVVLLLFAVGILIWFSIKKTDKEIKVKKPEQAEDKGLRALYDAELKKKGPAAVGTFDKWKENRKKNEKTAAKGLPSKKDGNTANKKKAVKKEQPKSKNDIVQEKYEKEWYQYVYNSEYLPELKKKGIAVVGTFDQWKKNRPPPAATTMIEQSPMTKTAMGTDKSVVDKGKSSTGVDGKKSATVEDIVQPFAEDPVIPDPPKKAEKDKDEEWTLEENEYDDDGNLLPKVEKGGIDCPPSTESERILLSI